MFSPMVALFVIGCLLTMRIITGIRDIIDDHDVILLDMYGVVHNGTTPYPGVASTLRNIRSTTTSKVVVALSNSYRRSAECATQLRHLGLDPEQNFDGIVTGCEVLAQKVFN